MPEREPLLARTLHYKVQFTADQEYMALLEEAREVLAHANPTRDFVEVQRRALELLVDHLRKRKHTTGGRRAGAEVEGARRAGAQTEHARRAEAAGSDASTANTDARVEVLPAAAGPRRRRPTAAVARAVRQRDDNRCAFVDERGQRCRETSMLQYHHERAWALGGDMTVDNLSLRCPVHNALAAERDFGRAHMARWRASGAPRDP